MSKTGYVLAALVGSLMITSASAQDSLVQYVENACATEIENFCSNVTPGEGRLLLCFAAHEDKISERCQYALYQASSALEQATAALSYLARSCRSDIETLCPETQPGDGRILECLQRQEEQVSDTCKDAVSDVSGS